MKIYSEERTHWMGSDVARYRRKRAVSLPDYAMPKMVKYGIVHPELCFGDCEPERMLIVHLREADVTAHPRLALFKLAWVLLRDAMRRYPAHLRRPVAALKPASNTVAITLKPNDTPTGPAVPGCSLQSGEGSANQP